MPRRKKPKPLRTVAKAELVARNVVGSGDKDGVSRIVLVTSDGDEFVYRDVQKTILPSGAIKVSVTLDSGQKDEFLVNEFPIAIKIEEDLGSSK